MNDSVGIVSSKATTSSMHVRLELSRIGHARAAGAGFYVSSLDRYAPFPFPTSRLPGGGAANRTARNSHYFIGFGITRAPPGAPGVALGRFAQEKDAI